MGFASFTPIHVPTSLKKLVPMVSRVVYPKSYVVEFKFSVDGLNIFRCFVVDDHNIFKQPRLVIAQVSAGMELIFFLIIDTEFDMSEITVKHGSILSANAVSFQNLLVIFQDQPVKGWRAEGGQRDQGGCWHLHLPGHKPVWNCQGLHQPGGYRWVSWNCSLRSLQCCGRMYRL